MLTFARARGIRVFDAVAIGVVSICSFRPFPLDAVRIALEKAKRVVILEKCMAVGIGGIVSDGVRKALYNTAVKSHTVIAGLGGRPIPMQSLVDLFQRAARDGLDPLNFLDLNWEVINRELARGRQQRRAGPTAENILRDLHMTGARAG